MGPGGGEEDGGESRQGKTCSQPEVQLRALWFYHGFKTKYLRIVASALVSVIYDRIE